MTALIVLAAIVYVFLGVHAARGMAKAFMIQDDGDRDGAVTLAVLCGVLWAPVLAVAVGWTLLRVAGRPVARFVTGGIQADLVQVCPFNIEDALRAAERYATTPDEETITP